MSVNIQNVLAGIAANVAARDAATAPPPDTCSKCNEEMSKHEMKWKIKNVSGYLQCPKEEPQPKPQPEPRPEPQPTKEANPASGVDVTGAAKATPPATAPPQAAAIATKFVQAGGHVIFFSRGTKRCTVPGWEQKATNNLEVALAWAEQDPSANVGIVGKQDGLWGLDDDAGLLTEYESQYGPIPTYGTHTVSGGRHFIFRQNAESWAMGNVSVEDENGRELLSARISNRYVVAAGSWAYPNNDTTKPLTQYTAINPDAPFVEAPAQLLEFIKQKAAQYGAKPSKPKSEAKAEQRIYLEGGRNKALASLAGRLRNGGANEEEILTTITRVNAEQCSPPLPEHEVKSIAKSIGSYPAGQDFSLLLTGATAPGANAANATVSDIPVIEDESENDPRFEMNGDTFDTKVYEQLSHRTTHYPDPGDDDLVSIVAKAYVHGTNIPLAYCREPLKQMVLHGLDGMLFHPAYPELSLRGNHMNVGESDGGKTFGLEFSLEAGRAILATNNIHTESLFRYKSETTFIRSFTPEGTIKRDSKDNIKSGSPGHSSQFLHIKEGNLVAKCTDYFGAVFAQLTNMYDQSEAVTESMTNGNFTAKQAKVSTVMCFTPTDYTATFGGKGSIGSGGLNRWTLSNPPRIAYYDDKDWERLPAKTLECLSTELAERVRQLVGGVKIILTEEPGAKEVRLRVKAMLKKVGKVGKRLMDYFVREQIAQAATAADGSLVMTTKQAEYAERWVMAQVQARLDCWPNDSSNPIEAMEHTIRKVVSSHFVSESKLKDACHFYREGSGGWYVYRSALGNCIESGAVKWTGRTRRGAKTFCPGSCAVHSELQA